MTKIPNPLRRMPTLLALLVSACGVVEDVEPPLADHTQEIVGGTMTPAGMFPEVGAMLRNGVFHCTGTLIGPRTVLTAAHCLSAGTLEFTFNQTAVNVPAASRFPVIETRRHPSYGPDHDLAILVLGANPPRPYARFPPRWEGYDLWAGDALVLVGYGATQTNGGGASGTMRHGTATLQAKQYPNLVLPPFSASNAQTCYGDSGGPAFASYGPTNALRIAGVTSRSAGGSNCAQGSIHSWVNADMDWIYLNGEVPCDSGDPCPRPVCGDGICYGESYGSCPQDCTTPAGDGQCTLVWGESTSNSPDCYCGDAICDPDESSSGSCTSDCTPHPDGTCPNGVCDGNENWAECPQDCH